MDKKRSVLSTDINYRNSFRFLYFSILLLFLEKNDNHDKFNHYKKKVPLITYIMCDFIGFLDSNDLKRICYIKLILQQNFFLFAFFIGYGDTPHKRCSGVVFEYLL